MSLTCLCSTENHCYQDLSQGIEWMNKCLVVDDTNLMHTANLLSILNIDLNSIKKGKLLIQNESLLFDILSIYVLYRLQHTTTVIYLPLTFHRGESYTNII